MAERESDQRQAKWIAARNWLPFHVLDQALREQERRPARDLCELLTQRTLLTLEQVAAVRSATEADPARLSRRRRTLDLNVDPRFDSPSQPESASDQLIGPASHLDLVTVSQSTGRISPFPSAPFLQAPSGPVSQVPEAPMGEGVSASSLLGSFGEPGAGLVGTRIGPYTVIDALSRGAQGLVLRARVAAEIEDGRSVAPDTDSDAPSSATPESSAPRGKDVAIKVLGSLGKDDRAFERFRREIEVLSRLEHPGIVKVLDVGEDEALPWFAMDYVAGATLEAVNNARISSGEGPAAPIETAKLFLELARALSYCHSKGVTHRDLKPSNILVRHADKQPILIDFGIVKWERSTTDEEEDSDISRSGEVRGTPGYMAPEQADPKGEFGIVGDRTDVWGFGATLFYALTGRPPYFGRSPANIYAAMMTREPERVRALNPAAPVWLDALCHQCLQRSIRNRPRMKVIVQQLETGLAEISAERASARRRHDRRRRPLFLAAITTVVGVFGAFLVQRSQEERIETSRIEDSLTQDYSEAYRQALRAELALEAGSPASSAEDLATLRRRCIASARSLKDLNSRRSTARSDLDFDGLRKRLGLLRAITLLWPLPDNQRPSELTLQEVRQLLPSESDNPSLPADGTGFASNRLLIWARASLTEAEADPAAIKEPGSEHRKRYETAAAEYKKLVESSPEISIFTLRRAQLLRSLGRLDEAINAISKAISLCEDPNQSAELWMLKLHCLREDFDSAPAGSRQLSAASLDEALSLLSLQPTLSDSRRLELLTCAEELGRQELCRSLARRLGRSGEWGKDWRTQLPHARESLERHRPAEVLRHLRIDSEAPPQKRLEAYWLQARAASDLGLYEDALRTCNQLLELSKEPSQRELNLHARRLKLHLLALSSKSTAPKAFARFEKEIQSIDYKTLSSPEQEIFRGICLDELNRLLVLAPSRAFTVTHRGPPMMPEPVPIRSIFETLETCLRKITEFFPDEDRGLMRLRLACAMFVFLRLEPWCSRFVEAIADDSDRLSLVLRARYELGPRTFLVPRSNYSPTLVSEFARARKAEVMGGVAWDLAEARLALKSWEAALLNPSFTPRLEKQLHAAALRAPLDLDLALAQRKHAQLSNDFRRFQEWAEQALVLDPTSSQVLDFIRAPSVPKPARLSGIQALLSFDTAEDDSPITRGLRRVDLAVELADLDSEASQSALRDALNVAPYEPRVIERVQSLAASGSEAQQQARRLMDQVSQSGLDVLRDSENKLLNAESLFFKSKREDLVAEGKLELFNGAKDGWLEANRLARAALPYLPRERVPAAQLIRGLVGLRLYQRFESQRLAAWDDLAMASLHSLGAAVRALKACLDSEISSIDEAREVLGMESARATSEADRGRESARRALLGVSLACRAPLPPDATSRMERDLDALILWQPEATGPRLWRAIHLLFDGAPADAVRELELLCLAPQESEIPIFVQALRINALADAEQTEAARIALEQLRRGAPNLDLSAELPSAIAWSPRFQALLREGP